MSSIGLQIIAQIIITLVPTAVASTVGKAEPFVRPLAPGSSTGSSGGSIEFADDNYAEYDARNVRDQLAYFSSITLLAVAGVLFAVVMTRAISAHPRVVAARASRLSVPLSISAQKRLSAAAVSAAENRDRR